MKIVIINFFKRFIYILAVIMIVPIIGSILWLLLLCGIFWVITGKRIDNKLLEFIDKYMDYIWS